MIVQTPPFHFLFVSLCLSLSHCVCVERLSFSVCLCLSLSLSLDIILTVINLIAWRSDLEIVRYLTISVTTANTRNSGKLDPVLSDGKASDLLWSWGWPWTTDSLVTALPALCNTWFMQCLEYKPRALCDSSSLPTESNLQPKFFLADDLISLSNWKFTMPSYLSTFYWCIIIFIVYIALILDF